MIVEAPPNGPLLVPCRGQLFRLAVAVAALSFYSLAPAEEARTGGSHRPAVIRVGVEPDAPPMTFLNPDGQPAGFAVDLVKAVAKERNLTIVFDKRERLELLAEFKAGKIDALASMAYTRERATFANFSIPTVAMKCGLYIRRGDTSIRTIGDLWTKRVAVLSNGYTHDFVVRHQWTQQVVPSPSVMEALKSLDRGECDAVPSALLVGNRFVKELHLENVQLSAVPVDDLNYELHLAVPLGHTDLLYEFNAGLNAIRSNGIYTTLYEKWIAPYEPRDLRWKDLQPYSLPTLFITMAMSLVFWHQRHLLRRLKRQAEALQVNQERLTLVLEGSQDAFWDWDIRTKRVTRSDRWIVLVDRKPGEIDGDIEAIDALIHPDDLSRVRQARQIMLQQGHGRVEYRLRTRDGRWRWILDRGKVVARDNNGVPIRMTGAAMDISTRKQIEEALGRSQTLLEQSQRAAEIGGWEYDVATRTLYWTLQAYRIHDLDPDTDTVTIDRLLSFYAPTSRSLVREAFRRAEEEGAPFDLEFELLTANKRAVWVRSIGRADKNAQGVVRVYGSFQDISRRKREEDERQKLQLKMLEAQKLESLGVLAGGIAHDFNNLLTVIMGNASIAKEAPETAPDALQQIEIAAARAGDLCRQMLAYAGKGPSITGNMDLNVLVSDTIDLLKLSIKKNATLDFSFAPAPLSVDADASQMRQVIMNLVINASDAIGSTGGRIRISTSQLRAGREMLREARLGQELREGDYAAFDVEDDGCGMSAETLARIFDPFFTTKFAGRGLGLAAVLGIVRSHRGAFFVRSTPGRGSCFRMLLPLARAATALSQPTAPLAKTRLLGSPGTFLVVDDEPSVRKLASTMLERQGHTVAVASDGYEALALALAHGARFTAVLLDLTMPGLDGPTTLRELRLMSATVPVLLMSGYSEADARKHMDHDPCVDFLPKPFTADILAKHLYELIVRTSPLQERPSI